MCMRLNMFSGTMFLTSLLSLLTTVVAVCENLERHIAERQELQKDLFEAQDNNGSLSEEIRWSENRVKIMKDYLSSGNTGNSVTTLRPILIDEQTEITALIYDAMVEVQEATDGNIESMSRVFNDRVDIAAGLVGSALARSMIERMIKAESVGYTEAKTELESSVSLIQTLQRKIKDFDESISSDRSACIAFLLKNKQRLFGDLKRINQDIELLWRKAGFVKAGINAYAKDLTPTAKPGLFILYPPYFMAPGITRELLISLFKLPDLGLTVPVMKAQLILGIGSLFKSQVIHADALIHSLVTDLLLVERELCNNLERRKTTTMLHINKVQQRLEKINLTA